MRSGNDGFTLSFRQSFRAVTWDFSWNFAVTSQKEEPYLESSSAMVVELIQMCQTEGSAGAAGHSLVSYLSKKTREPMIVTYLWTVY